MKLLQMIKKINIVLFVAGFIAMSIPVVPASASSKIDMSKLGSISIDLSKSNTSVTEIYFTVYKIADLLDTGDYKLVSDFSNSGVQLDQLSIASQLATAAKTLADYAKSMKIDGTLIKPDANGTMNLDQLTLGYYLVVQTDSKKQQMVTPNCNPFLVMVPMAYTNGSGWLYNIIAYPKLEAGSGAVVSPALPNNSSVVGKTPDPIITVQTANDTGKTPEGAGQTPTLIPSPAVNTREAGQNGEGTDSEIIDDLPPRGAPDSSEITDMNTTEHSSSSNDNGQKKDYDNNNFFNLPKTGGSIAYAICKYAGTILIVCGFVVLIISMIRKSKRKIGSDS